MATFVEIRNLKTGNTVRTVNLSDEQAKREKANLEHMYHVELGCPEYMITIVTDNSIEDGN